MFRARNRLLSTLVENVKAKNENVTVKRKYPHYTVYSNQYKDVVPQKKIIFQKQISNKF